jgi:hypothetical protein
MNVYFDKEEAAFVLSQEKGFVRRLVREAMTAPQAAQEAPQVDEERAREHFPPRDVFGPRLKR